MKFLKVFLFLFLSNFIFSQNEFTPKYFTSLETENGMVVINKQCSRSIPKKIKKFWVVEETQINLLHKNFNKIKEVRAKLCCWTNGIIENIEEYGYQYVGITIKKKKYIYINAFHTSMFDFDNIGNKWKTKPIIVCDGGDYFWGILFNLETQEFEQLAINGIG